MSVYSKLDMNLGGWCDRKGRTWWEAPQTPLINLRYRKDCGFSPNSNKAYSSVICFFCCKKEPLVFWFVFIFNSEINFFFLVWLIFELTELVVHLSGFFRLQQLFLKNKSNPIWFGIEYNFIYFSISTCHNIGNCVILTLFHEPRALSSRTLWS